MIEELHAMPGAQELRNAEAKLNKGGKKANFTYCGLGQEGPL